MLAEGEGAADTIPPPSIQALLAARLDRLPVDERALPRACRGGGKGVQGAVRSYSCRGTPSAIRSDARLLSLVRKDLLAAIARAVRIRTGSVTP